MLRFGTALLFLLPAAAGSLDLLSPASAALLGREPYAEIAAHGMPLPPTAAKVDALPVALRVQQSAAIKEVLLLRYAWLRANANRSSTAVEANSAGAARSAEAPALMAELLQMMADGNLSRPQSYAWRLVWNELMSAYGVDALWFRLMVQELDLTPEELQSLMPELPLADMGNTLPIRKPSEAQIVADLRLMSVLYTTLAAQYQLVEDEESAARAADVLRPVLQQMLTTVCTRFWVFKADSAPTSAELEALKEANGAYRAFLEQRARLAEQGFFGSLPLRVLDYLAD